LPNGPVARINAAADEAAALLARKREPCAASVARYSAARRARVEPMRSALNEETFDRLLGALDANREHAAERYEDLRRTLLRFFEWRGAPFPEEHADETFDRVARRLDQGVVVSNIGAYLYGVARHVLLETRKDPERHRVAVDVLALDPAQPVADESGDDEGRLVCLEKCLNGLAPDARALIVGYYRDDTCGRIETRRAMAARLGINADALANRAQRLRDKLHGCVRACLSGT
jgi:DNA-directed RNA polymerase specialized sigma24 family protein